MEESHERPDCQSSSSTHSLLNLSWHHAPPHRLEGQGVFMVTGSTFQRLNIFHRRQWLDVLTDSLLENAERHAWNLEAWAVFSNHYHFIGRALEDASTLEPFMRCLHSETASYINGVEGVRGRRVWFNYWDTRLTFTNSYLARLNYVHQNPVRHGLVSVANQYRWCSAAWFERTAKASFVKTVYQFKLDKVRVRDDYAPKVGD